MKITSPLDRELIDKGLCLWCHAPVAPVSYYCSEKCKKLKESKNDGV